MNLVLDIIIRSTTVLLAAGFAAFLLRRTSASIRHGIWALGVAGALVLPLAGSVLPEFEIPVLHVTRTVASSLHMLAQPAEETIASEPAALVWQAAPSEATSRAQFFLAAVWLLGCGVVLGRFAMGLLAVRRLLLESADANDGLCRLTRELQAELRMNRRVRVVQSDRQISPMTCGYFRHVIILPASLTLWPELRQRAILLHELAHVKRNDGLMQLLLHALCALYWFNPVVWYAARCVRIEREHACDDQVLGLGVSPEDYATYLLDIARALASTPRFSAAMGSMGERSQLEKRIVSILNPHLRRRSMSRLATVAALCLISPIGAALALGRPTAGLFSSAPRVAASSLRVAGQPAVNPNGVLTPPQLISFVQPPYTADAFESGAEGTVTLETQVDAEGNASVVRVVDGPGHGLNESASGAVSSWKFSPALRNGAPVEASMQIRVEFTRAQAAIRLASDITPPKVVRRVDPKLPQQARAAEAGGTVVLEIVVRPDGTVGISRVIQPLGYGLTESAIQALKQWTFEPGTKDGERLPISMNASVNFDWKSSESERQDP